MKSNLRILLVQAVLSVAACAATICTTPSGRYLAVPVENRTPATLLEVFDGDRRIVRTYMQWAGGTTNWIGSLDLGPAKRQLAWQAKGAKRPVTDPFERAWRLKRAIDRHEAE